jgi:hypothetical protein
MMGVSGGARMKNSDMIMCVDALNPKSYGGSGTTWSDVSGNGNDGNLTNSPTYSSDGYFDFDGTNDRVVFSDTPFRINGNQLTVATWVEHTDTDRRDTILGKRQDSPYHQYNMTFGGSPYNSSSDNRVFCFFRSDGNASTANVVYDLDAYDAGPMHIAFVCNTTSQQLYINGVEKATGSTDFTVDTFNITDRDFVLGNVCVGGNTTYGTAHMDGKMYNAVLYDTALTAAEVLEMYNSTRGRFGL